MGDLVPVGSSITLGGHRLCFLVVMKVYNKDVVNGRLNL